MTDDPSDPIRHRLAAALFAPMPDWTGGSDGDYWQRRLDRGVAVVEAYARERAAAVLLDAADAVPIGDGTRAWLAARADALDAGRG